MKSNHEELKRKFNLYQSASNDVKELNQQGKFAKLDMHIHTTMSDGTFSIPQIIYIAKKFNLERIFITDHNTCLPGYKVLKDIPKSFLGELKVDIGCEIATKIEDHSTGKFIPIEILSYFSDPYQIQTFLNKYEFGYNIPQQEQLNLLLDTCDKLGLIHSNNINVPKGAFATETLCKDLIRYVENKDYFMKKAPIVWTSPKLFYKKLVANPEGDFYFDTTKGLPYYKDTISTIIKAGGVPVVAHPFLYIYQDEIKVKNMLDYILDTSQIKGIEAFHSSHTVAQRKFLADYARKNNLVYSGGSDFHCGPQTILGYGKKDSPILLSPNDFKWLK